MALIPLLQSENKDHCTLRSLKALKMRPAQLGRQQHAQQATPWHSLRLAFPSFFHLLT